MSTKFLGRMIIIIILIIIFDFTILLFTITPGSSMSIFMLVFIFAIITLFFFLSFYIHRRIAEKSLLRIENTEGSLGENTGLLFEKPKSSKIYKSASKSIEKKQELTCLHCGNKILDKDQVICEKCGNNL